MELAVNKTLKNIEQKLSGDDDKANPTVLWSGNGYHIIQSVECQMVLENIKQFQKLYNRIETLRYIHSPHNKLEE